MKHTAYIEVRKVGSIGSFSWQSVPIESESTDEQELRDQALKEAHDSGFETRGLTWDVAELGIGWHHL
jgi:hypothetical protein